MCLICNTENIQNIIYLTKLECSECPLLTEIPQKLVNLTHLDYFRCPLLTKISGELVNLTRLYCSWCPLLTKIPEELVNVIELDCSECKWLRQNDDMYDQNIQRLLFCQKTSKKYLCRRKERIKEYIPLIRDISTIIMEY
jgi:hypothetical protein